MDKQFMDQETARLLNSAIQVMADALRKLWEEIIRLVKAAADAIMDAFKPLRLVLVQMRQEIVYQRLRRYYVPDKVARWIACRLVCRG